MENTIVTYQIQLSYSAHKSFIAELANNGISFSPITKTSLLVNNSPKVRTAITLTKERFGAQSIYITNANY
jgi:hypothetical protein